MKKSSLVVGLFLLAQLSFGQRTIEKTDAFQITGEIEKDTTLTVADLMRRPSVAVHDFVITNHRGEKKSEAHGLKGVLLRPILDSLVVFKTDKPKDLSAFYLVFVASDDYKVVFSWNEIFNTPVGEQLFLVVEKDGKTLLDMDERILLVSASDLKTGRRYVKGLKKIIVSRVP